MSDYSTTCTAGSELLRGGHSVTKAALSSGFHGASYFAEVFRRVYGKTPKQYRKGAAPLK